MLNILSTLYTWSYHNQCTFLLKRFAIGSELCLFIFSNFITLYFLCTCNVLEAIKYRQVSNIRHTLVGYKIVDYSDVVGASPVGAAPTTSSFST